MALYHLSVKTISRSAGRSATASAAYRSGCEIVDNRTGLVHDYSRKTGVESCDILLPENAPKWASNRSDLWNEAEQSETRKNSTVAREFEVALPAELTHDQRRELALIFAKEIVERHGCAADVSIHAPNKEGDQRNYHAHILVSTRRLEAEGFTEKTRELDERKSGEIERWRERFSELQNESLQRYGHDERVDHRSLEAQGIDRSPQSHLGVEVTALERRGVETEVVKRIEDEVSARLEVAAELGRLERENSYINKSIIDLESTLQEALKFREMSMRAEVLKEPPVLDKAYWQSFGQGYAPPDRGNELKALFSENSTPTRLGREEMLDLLNKPDTPSNEKVSGWLFLPNPSKR